MSHKLLTILIFLCMFGIFAGQASASVLTSQIPKAEQLTSSQIHSDQHIIVHTAAMADCCQSDNEGPPCKHCKDSACDTGACSSCSHCITALLQTLTDSTDSAAASTQLPIRFFQTI